MSIPVKRPKATAAAASGCARRHGRGATHLPVSIYNADGESWTYSYFYGLSIGLEVLLLAYILRSAWTWPRRTASPPAQAASLDTEPRRTPQQA